MKLVLFDGEGKIETSPGLLTDHGIVDISEAVQRGHTPQLTIRGIIDDFEELRPKLEVLAANGLEVVVEELLTFGHRLTTYSGLVQDHGVDLLGFLTLDLVVATGGEQRGTQAKDGHQA